MDHSGNTALLRAAYAGEREAVPLTLDRGSEVNFRNLDGSTALLRAVTMNQRRTTMLLLDAGAEVDVANKIY